MRWMSCFSYQSVLGVKLDTDSFDGKQPYWFDLQLCVQRSPEESDCQGAEQPSKKNKKTTATQLEPALSSFNSGNMAGLTWTGNVTAQPPTGGLEERILGGETLFTPKCWTLSVAARLSISCCQREIHNGVISRKSAKWDTQVVTDTATQWKHVLQRFSGRFTLRNSHTALILLK